MIAVDMNARVADRDTVTARVAKENVPTIAGKPRIDMDSSGFTIR